MKNNKIFLGTALTLGSVATVVVPLATIVSCGDNSSSENSFKPFSYKGNHFNNAEEVKEFIKSNSTEKNYASNERLFYINGIGDNLVFQSQDAAKNYLIQHFMSEEEVYVSSDMIKGDQISQDFVNGITGEIKESNFYNAKDEYIYTVFKTSSLVGDGHHYLAAKSPINAKSDVEKAELTEKWNEVRNKAALSYISVHSAYFFDGIYFPHINAVSQYLMSKNPGDIKTMNTQSIENNQKFSYSKLVFADGTSETIQIDKSTNEITNDYKELLKSRAWNAKPYFMLGNTPTELNYDSLPNFASQLNENSLDYIKVIPTSTPTYIVDMDKSTPSGRFYGPYFAQTALGMNGITEKIEGHLANWHETSEVEHSASLENQSFSELRGILNYVATKAGLDSPLKFLSLLKNRFSTSNATLRDFLKSISVPIVNQSNSVTNLWDASVYFMENLSNGSSYNMIDSLNSLNSFIINQMIQDKLESSKIIEFAQFMQTALESLDSLLAHDLAPFFMKDANGHHVGIDSSFKLDYLASGMSFYDPKLQSHGINFQRDPQSYLRLLTGNGTNSQANISDPLQSKNKFIFKVLKTYMGIESLKISVAKHNENTFRGWLKNNNGDILDPTWADINQVNSVETSFIDLKFRGLAENDKSSMEYVSIWSHMNADSGAIADLKIGNYTYDMTTISTNIDAYLMNDVNVIGEDMHRKVETSKEKIKSDAFETGFDEKWNTLSKISSPDLTDNDIEKHIIQSILLLDKQSPQYNDELEKIKQSYRSGFVASRDWKMFWRYQSVIELKNQYSKSEGDKGRYSPISILNDTEKTLIQNALEPTPTGSYLTYLKSMEASMVVPLLDRLANFGGFVAETVVKAGIAMYSGASAASGELLEFANKNRAVNPFKDFDSAFTHLQTLKGNGAVTAVEKYNDAMTEVRTDAFKNTISSVVGTHDFASRLWNDKDYKIHDPFGEFSGPTKAIITLANKLKDPNYELSLKDAGSLILETLGIDNEIVSAITSTTMNVIQNVFPLVDKFFSFINSFSSSETKVFTYENGDQIHPLKYYWNGVTIDNSWWGLVSEQHGSINDLKMIDSTEIIGEYSSSNSGVYYNGNFYTDSVAIRANAAKDILDNLLINRGQQFSSNIFEKEETYIDNKSVTQNIFWGIALKDNSNSEVLISGKSKKELFNTLIEKAKNNSVSSEMFTLSNGMLTLNSIQAQTDAIKQLTASLKPVMIFQLPELNSNGFPKDTTRFELPSPHWINGIIGSGAIDIEKQSRYRIVDPNVATTPSANDVKIAGLVRDTYSIFSDVNAINAISLNIAKTIPVENKNVLYEQIMQNSRNSIAKYEGSDLDPNIVLHKKAIVSALNSFGERKFFENFSSALEFIKVSFSIISNSISKSEIHFMFENAVFSSLDEIYKFMVNNSDKGVKNE